LNTLRIGWLYPDLMNMYGDRGNIIALVRRARWRGVEVQVRDIGLGLAAGLEEIDLFFFGGGQDKEQTLVYQDLLQYKAAALSRAHERQVVILAVCGGYQLLAHHYETPDGKRLRGLGLIDAHTVGGAERLIGNAVVESEASLGLMPKTLVGFENHSGRTWLGAGVRPLGRILSGYGNNAQDGSEGAVSGNLIATYLHGSLLPKNPHLVDWLLERALGEALGPLQDEVEWDAHEAARARTMGRRSG